MFTEGEKIMKHCKAGFFSNYAICVVSVLLILNFSWLSSAGAQEDKLNPDVLREEQGLKTSELEMITVTAQKQEENVQDVPVSITVFNEQDIEDRGIESIRELADFVPNFMVFNEGISGMNSPSMRGIHVGAHTFTATTGLYVDGVPILSAIGFEDVALDIERIEVLRGPQGTLYGKNTEAGTVNIITRQPDNEIRARVLAEGARLLSAEAGDKLKGLFSLNVSGPLLEDRLFLGVSGQYEKKDGFIENTTTGEDDNDREHWFGRGHLRWTPTEKLEISLIASRLKYDEGASNMSLYADGAAAFYLPDPEDRKVSSNLDANNEGNSESQVLKISYDLSDSLKLTSVTTRRVFNDKCQNDFDFSSATYMHIYKDGKYKKISQELRLNYAKDKPKWLVGFYYDKDDNDIDYEVKGLPNLAKDAKQDLTGDAYAAFANFTYPFTERFSLVGGLRYEKQDMEFETNLYGGTKMDDSWTALTPRLGIEYCFTPAIMGYVTISKGYRSGGFNFLATDAQYFSFDEEELWNYEIGVKSSFFKNRLILNGAIYYMDISDMQVEESVSPLVSYLTNAAEATGKGVELEMTALVAKGLKLMARFGYNHVEFDKFKDVKGDYAGNKNPYAPIYTFNIGAQYRFQNGIYARADLIGYGEMYLDRANEYKRDAYEIVNAKIGYETEHFDFYLYGKNIFDKEYNSYGYYNGYYTIYSNPGEVGLQLVYRF
jgi:iron complex outermembrane receptor protein